MIPFEHSKKIYAAANNPKCFIELNGGHNDGGLLAAPETVSLLKKFVEDIWQKGVDK